MYVFGIGSSLARAVPCRSSERDTALAALEIALDASDLEQIGAGADADELAAVEHGDVLDALVDHHVERGHREVVGCYAHKVLARVLEHGGVAVRRRVEDIAPREDADDVA